MPDDAMGPMLREPVYPLTEGVTNRRMGQIVGMALERAPDLPEWIEPSVLERHGWPNWRAALAAAHDLQDEAKAKDRLAYDELLANQLALLLVRRDTRERKGRALAGDGRLTAPLVASLPWAMTGAQQRVLLHYLINNLFNIKRATSPFEHFVSELESCFGCDKLP